MYFNLIEENGILKIDTLIGKIPYEENKKYLNSDYVETVESQLNKNKVAIDIKYYINKIANKMGWDYEDALGFLRCVDNISKSAFFSILLKEIAIELDKKYEDHIKYSDEIYVISITNGHIAKINKKFIKNYNNFAAFRTMDDAKLAAKILRPCLREMFKNGKQKD